MFSVSLGTEQDPNKRDFCYCIADVVMTTNILVISPKLLNFTELRVSIHIACFPALVFPLEHGNSSYTRGIYRAQDDVPL